MIDQREMQASSYVAQVTKRRLEMAMCSASNSQRPASCWTEANGGIWRAHRYQTKHHRSAQRLSHEKRQITMAIIRSMTCNVVFSLAQRIHALLAQGMPLVEDTPDKIKGHPKSARAYLGEAAD